MDNTEQILTDIEFIEIRMNAIKNQLAMLKEHLDALKSKLVVEDKKNERTRPEGGSPS